MDVRHMDHYIWMIESADLLILGDVLEHMTKKEGMEVLKRAYPNFKMIMINTPLGFLKQDGTHDNPHEEHVSGYYPFDFYKYTIIEQNLRQPIHGMAGLFNLLLEGGRYE